MNLTPPPEQKPLSVGQHVRIIHYPGNNPAIEIQAVIVRAQHPEYWIDTDFQRSVKINRKHITA